MRAVFSLPYRSKYNDLSKSRNCSLIYFSLILERILMKTIDKIKNTIVASAIGASYYAAPKNDPDPKGIKSHRIYISDVSESVIRYNDGTESVYAEFTSMPNKQGNFLLWVKEENLEYARISKFLHYIFLSMYTLLGAGGIIGAAIGLASLVCWLTQM